MIMIGNVMKRLFSAAALVAACTLVHAQGTYTLKGTVKGGEGKTVYVMRGIGGAMAADSAVVHQGQFVVKGEVADVMERALLFVGKIDSRNYQTMATLYLEPGAQMTATIDAAKVFDATITGSRTQNEYNEYYAMVKDDMLLAMEMNDKYYQADEQEKAAIQAKMAPIGERVTAAEKKFIEEHPDSYITPTFIEQEMGRMSYEELKAIYDKLSDRVKQSTVCAKVRSEVETLEKVRPGGVAPLFSAKDVNGKQFSLSDLRGKVVIIDFWASWCVPCRKSNPHMRSLYDKYHAKGLELVYVASDDGAEAKWRKAIDDDQLHGEGYHHVLSGYDQKLGRVDNPNDIGNKYAIHYLPTKYLIDREGKIVFKVESDEQLDQKLAEMMP
jgi:thiol-disulfide isomerase/thioredoxin